MAVKNDYDANRVSDMGRLLSDLINPGSNLNYEIISDDLSEEDFLYMDIVKLAHKGKINEAENTLYEALESMDDYDPATLFRVALGFYMQLNEYSDDFLEDNNYSREEITEGLQSLGQYYGIDLGEGDQWV